MMFGLKKILQHYTDATRTENEFVVRMLYKDILLTFIIHILCIISCVDCCLPLALLPCDHM